MSFLLYEPPYLLSQLLSDLGLYNICQGNNQTCHTYPKVQLDVIVKRQEYL